MAENTDESVKEGTVCLKLGARESKPRGVLDEQRAGV